MTPTPPGDPPTPPPDPPSPPSDLPTPPSDLPGLIRRSARVTRIAGYVTVLVPVIPLTVIGLAAALDDAPVLGTILIGVGLLGVLAVTLSLRHRYGADGARWEQQLTNAATTGEGWREVDVWFVRPGLTENERSQRIALIAEPDGRPHLASKLLVTAGAGLEPGRARLWASGRRGRPALLEKDGHPLWPSRPAQGRVGVGLARFAAATPLSNLTVDRPQR